MALSYSDWMDKYGLDELEEYLREMEQEDEDTDDLDEDEWLSSAYSSYISEAEDRAYEQHKDDKLMGLD